MRTGSIVECIKNEHYKHIIKPEKHPKTYTVREIIPAGTIKSEGVFNLLYTIDAVFLEELYNPDLNYPQLECPYQLKDFRELLPPMENIEETINENVIEIEEVELV